GRILVRDEYLDQVLRIDGTSVERSLIRGVTLVNVTGFQGSALDAVAYVNSLYGAGVSAPDHVVSIAPGEAGWCPATEPDVVPPWATPDPVVTADHAAGE